jgi:ubiquinol-cytochrome c reductase cytochrome c1 subunit
MEGKETMMRSLMTAALLCLGLTVAAAPALAAGYAKEPRTPEQGWTFEGFFGRYDKASLQRGFQVYKEVCAACHGMRFLSYRNLGEPGGPGFTEAEVRAIASEYQVPAGPDDEGNIVDEFGQLLTRTALPSDRFAKPYPNEQAARAANGGAFPPDLSLMNKARHNGHNYVWSLLTGYEDAPDGVELQPGMSYNPYFPGKQIAMAPVLSDGMLEYADGTPATVAQMAYDVTNFMMWAAEPKLEQRKRLGLQVMLFLFVLTGLLYASYRKLWRNIEH